jgi:hypothetical protein
MRDPGIDLDFSKRYRIASVQIKTPRSLIPHHGHIHALQSKISNSRIGIDPDTEKVLFESIETPI